MLDTPLVYVKHIGVEVWSRDVTVRVGRQKQQQQKGRRRGSRGQLAGNRKWVDYYLPLFSLRF